MSSWLVEYSPRQMLNQGNIHSIVKQTSISLPQRQEENGNNEAACDPSLVARFYCCVSKGIRTCVNKTDTFWTQGGKLRKEYFNGIFCDCIIVVPISDAHTGIEVVTSIDCCQVTIVRISGRAFLFGLRPNEPT